MSKLSIVLITYNSEKYLKEVLESALFADEVLILDSNSTDDTKKIAIDLGVKVYNHDWMGFGKQKQKAVDLAKNSWVFVLDSDEVITNELQEEIKNELKNPAAKAYEIPRLNYFFSKPIKRCGLYPDFTIRLFDKREAKFSLDRVHEKVICDKEVKKFKNHLLHYAYESIEEFITKQNRYSSLNAKPNRIKALFNPIWTFIKIYLLKRGFLEGWRGFIIAKLYAQYTFWKYIKRG